MSNRLRWMVIIGLAGMLLGAIDPLEGSPLIAAASGLVALAAHLGRSRHGRLASWAFVLMVVGVGAMWVLTAIGGVGGSTGRSAWWAMVVAPAVVGWIMGVVAAVRVLVDRRGGPRYGEDPQPATRSPDVVPPPSGS